MALDTLWKDEGVTGEGPMNAFELLTVLRD